MREQPPLRPEDAPGHYGAGYGEQVPSDAPPRPAPLTDDEKAAPASSGAATSAPATPFSPTTQARPGEAEPAAVFTPADVHARPPVRPPTDAAPESEKAGLIFERS